MSAAPQHIVVMGVSGSGKTTVGEALAAALGWRFVEGDSFHPASNVAKMSAGIPLDDVDRRPWLEALAAEIARDEAAGGSSVVGCSALKRAYRDILRTGAPRVRFLHVHGDRAVLAGRVSSRPGHFFPASCESSSVAGKKWPGRLDTRPASTARSPWTCRTRTRGAPVRRMSR